MSNRYPQSLRLIRVVGTKPEGSEWYEGRDGRKLLMQIIAEVPQDAEDHEADQAGIRIRKSFEAADGTTWGSMSLAKVRNIYIKNAQDLESTLLGGKRVDELNNGKGFFQHHKEAVDEVRIMLDRLLRDSGIKRDETGPILDEDHPYRRLQQRLACIDKNNREWQTPALAHHPDRGKQVRLNPAA